MDASAWRLLASQDYEDAFWLFARDVEDEPRSGRARVGCALALAGLRDLDAGAQCIRASLQIDPDSLRALAAEHRDPSLFNAPILQYHERLKQIAFDCDTVLALGALYYLRSDRISARHALDLLARLGEESLATANLESLIAEPLSRVEIAPQETGPTVARDRALERTEVSSPSADALSPAPGLPARAVDYGTLRKRILTMSEALDRFSQKLRQSLAEALPGRPPGSPANGADDAMLTDSVRQAGKPDGRG